MSDNERLDRIEKIAESNAKAIQALSSEAADHHRRSLEEIQALKEDIQILKSVTESNSRSILALTDTVADANRQLVEHSARTTSAIEELSQIVGTMARFFHDHVNDDQRHNPL